MKRKTLLIISGVIALLLFVGGVGAFLIIGFQKPEATVSDMEITGIDEDFDGFTMKVTLEVYNPNLLELEITDVEGDIRIDGKDMGNLKNRSGVVIPGRSQSNIAISVHVDDVESVLFTGSNLSIIGVVRGEYMSQEGSSDFDHNVELDELPMDVATLPPVAFIIGPPVARTMMEVIFDGSTSTDADGEIVSYSWDLGDGTTAEGERVTHRYSSRGTYTVKLTVEDDLGSTGFAEHQIIISLLRP